MLAKRRAIVGAATSGGGRLAIKGLPFRAAADGEIVSGKFAIVERRTNSLLSRWRPVIDRQLARDVVGLMRGGSMMAPPTFSGQDCSHRYACTVTWGIRLQNTRLAICRANAGT
ncbi:DUF3363 domain-containing protein [Acetobacteraceae bacterium H6797]|nr:DUF3363 domain-containing protein [Acetobacteraceae bacterium H6797]